MVNTEGSITRAPRQCVLNCFCSVLLLTEQIKERNVCLLHLQVTRKQDATAALLEVKIRIQPNPNKSEQANKKKKCNSIEEQGNLVQQDSSTTLIENDWVGSSSSKNNVGGYTGSQAEHESTVSYC